MSDLQPETSELVVWICPECGEQLQATDSYYDPARGRVVGHYHDPPPLPPDADDDYDSGPDPWFDAVKRKAVLVD